jgi:hypothetical protein
MIDEEQQAFPYGLLNQDGMTLRDYFAARGIETLIKSVTSELESKHYSIEKAQKIQDVYASMCYAMADAMLKAREK